MKVIKIKEGNGPKRFAVKGIVTDRGKSWEVTIAFKIDPKSGEMVDIRNWVKAHTPKEGTIVLPY